MKDRKITIAKSILIFAVLVVAIEVAVAVLFGVWTFPDAFWDVFWDAIFLLTYFCGGCLFAFLAAALTARQFARSIMLAVLWGIYAVAFYELVWIPIANLRLSMLLILLASVCFGAVLVCCKQFPKRKTVQKVVVIFAIVMGLPAGGMTALGAFLHWDTWDTLERTVNSPDGRYQAGWIDRTELDSEYHIVTIKPTYFSVFNILDYPNTEIIEVGDGETLKDMRWVSPHTLVVGYYSGTSFTRQAKSWRDVKIVYKDESKE